MATETRPAWLIEPGEVVLLDGRAAPVVGIGWRGDGRTRQRRIFYRDHDGKITYGDFDPSEWLTLVTVDPT